MTDLASSLFPPKDFTQPRWSPWQRTSVFETLYTMLCRIEHEKDPFDEDGRAQNAECTFEAFILTLSCEAGIVRHVRVETAAMYIAEEAIKEAAKKEEPTEGG